MEKFNKTEKSIIKHFVENPKVDIEGVLFQSSNLIYAQCIELMKTNNITNIVAFEIGDDLDWDFDYDNAYGVVVDIDDDEMHYCYIKSIELVLNKDEEYIKVNAYNLQVGETYQVDVYQMNGHIYNAITLRKLINDYIENNEEE